MLTIKIISLKGIIEILISLSFIPFANKSCNLPHSKELNSIILFSSIQAVKENGEFFSTIDSLYIHSYEQYTMYQIPEIYEYSNVTTDSIGNILDHEFIRSEIKFHYWVFKNGDSIGLRFDSLGSIACSKFKVDSLIDANTSFKQGISLDSYQLFEKVTDSAKYFFTEKYIPKVKRQATPDSSFLYFRNDWNSIDFSFSKDLDLQKKSKLYKFRIVFNPIPRGELPFDVPRRELIFEIRKPEIKNSEQILDLFKKLKSTTN